jgi:hypothetical protein
VSMSKMPTKMPIPCLAACSLAIRDIGWIRKGIWHFAQWPLIAPFDRRPTIPFWLWL